MFNVSNVAVFVGLLYFHLILDCQCFVFYSSNVKKINASEAWGFNTQYNTVISVKGLIPMFWGFKWTFATCFICLFVFRKRHATFFPPLQWIFFYLTISLHFTAPAQIYFSYHLMQCNNRLSDIFSAAYFAASVVDNSIIKSPLYSAESEFQKGNNIIYE